MRGRRSPEYGKQQKKRAAIIGSSGERDVADADRIRELQSEGSECDERGWIGDGSWWETEPDVGRVAHGIPARVDRLRSLGNAIVPQIAQIIGQAIIRYEGAAS